jgi:hypothetical protein
MRVVTYLFSGNIGMLQASPSFRPMFEWNHGTDQLPLDRHPKTLGTERVNQHSDLFRRRGMAWPCQFYKDSLANSTKFWQGGVVVGLFLLLYWTPSWALGVTQSLVLLNPENCQCFVVFVTIVLLVCVCVCKLIIDPFSPIISPLPSHDFPIISPCKPSVNDGESLEAARLGAMEPDVSPLRHLDNGAER